MSERNSPVQLNQKQALLDTSRSKLVYRILLFQFKLFADGVRDILLSPLSMIAGLLGIFFSANDPHYYFNKLLQTGRASEKWINLFDNETVRNNTTSRETLDGLARRFEDVVRRDYEKNGVSAKAARKFEEVLKDIRSRKG